jgi:hypothetical protein
MLAFMGLALSLASATGAPRPVAVIPFTANGTLVSLRVRVGGAAPRAFTLDSGASASVIDTGVANALGMRAAGSRLGTGAGAGSVRFLIFRNVRLTAGGAGWVAPTVYGISLHTVGTALQEDGLVGSDLFFRYVVDVDYATHRVSLYEPKGFRYAGAGAAIPLTFAKHLSHAAVTIKVRGRPAQVRRLLIDSGSEDMVDDAVVGTSTASKKPISTTGLGRSVRAYAGPIEWARIGPFTVRGLSGTSAGVPLLGTGVLRRFHVTFDYSRRRMYLEEARGTASVSRGAGAAQSAKTTRVSHSADTAGLGASRISTSTRQVICAPPFTGRTSSTANVPRISAPTGTGDTNRTRSKP